jgi:hypothetical protein
MRHMDWLFDALELPSDKEQRRRVDAAIRVALALPPEVHCPEVWSAIKALDGDGRGLLVTDVGRQLAVGDPAERTLGRPRQRPAP